MSNAPHIRPIRDQPAANEPPRINLHLPLGGRLTVGELVGMYLRDNATRTSNSSTRTNRYAARRLLTMQVDGDQLAAIDVVDVSRPMLQRLLLERAAGPRTTNTRIRMLGAAFRWGFAAGVLNEERDPTRALQYCKEPRSARGLPERAIRGIVYGLDLAELIGEAAQRWIDFTRIVLGVGMRVDELAKLLIRNIDLDEQTLHYVQKGNRQLTVAIPASIRPFIERQLAAATGDALYGVGRNTPTRYWHATLAPIVGDPRRAREQAGLEIADVATKLRRSVREVEAWEAMPPALVDSNGRRVSLAHLRACNVSTKIRRGVSTKLAGASIGHESERTTELHYVGPLFEQFAEVAKAMDTLFEASAPDDSPAGVIVARNIKARREALGLTQPQAAKQAKVSERTWVNWECDFGSFKKLDHVAAVLKCSRQQLIGGL